MDGIFNTPRGREVGRDGSTLNVTPSLPSVIDPLIRSSSYRHSFPLYVRRGPGTTSPRRNRSLDLFRDLVHESYSTTSTLVQKVPFSSPFSSGPSLPVYVSGSTFSVPSAQVPTSSGHLESLRLPVEPSYTDQLGSPGVLGMVTLEPWNRISGTLRLLQKIRSFLY